MRMLIDAQFPALAADGYEILGEPTEEDNCIAYAAGETHDWWDHIIGENHYWPAHASRTPAIASLVEVFAGLGFEICPDATVAASVEEGYDKIALY